MNSTTLSLWLSVTFLTFYFIAVLVVLLVWQHKQEKQNQLYLTLLSQVMFHSTREMTNGTQLLHQTMTEAAEVLSKNSLGQLEVLNKTMTLLSVKDPLAYQAVVAMEVPSTSEDEYYPQDDVSEALRREDLTAKGGYDDSRQWYEPNVNGAFDFDPISGSYGDGR
jgi:hypothetical protein